MRKLCLPLLFAVLFTAALGVGALAAPEVDMDYTGPVDNFTGEPIVGDSLDPRGNRVLISDRTVYDREADAYVYAVGDSTAQEIFCSVADGMIVTEAVRVTPGPGVSALLYRNGGLVAEPNFENITAVGNYTVEVNSQGGQGVPVLGFTIVGEQTGLISGYTMPEGFVISDVTMAGGTAAWDRFYLSLTEEGKYSISYACPAISRSYTLDVTIDHTAPTLALEAVQNGRATGMVDISDLEEGCAIMILLNGDQIAYEPQLTRSGNYALRLTDPAGNTSTYEFTILVYFNLSSYMFFALLLTAVAVTLAYVLIKRKNLRVR